MAPKKHEDHFGDIIKEAPPTPRRRQQIQSSKVERETKVVYEDGHGRISNQVTETEATKREIKIYDDKRGRPPPPRRRQQIQSSKVERETKVFYEEDHGKISNQVTETEAKKREIKIYDDKRGRQQIQSSKVERATTKEVHKDKHGRSPKQSTKTKSYYEAEVFVDKKTGHMAFKVVVKHSSTKKYDDKKQGYTHEYQTQVKHKHVLSK